MSRFASQGDERPRLEIALTTLALLTTAVASLMLCVHLVDAGRQEWGGSRSLVRLEIVLFAAAIAGLIYGVLVFQLSRLGYCLRRARSRVLSYETLLADPLGDDALPAVTMLVPSYKEDLRTIRQTLLSAALQDYPNRRIILLLDDPPFPANSADAAGLAAARRLPAELTAWLAGPRERVEAAAARFQKRAAIGFDPATEFEALLAAHAEVDAWFAVQSRAPIEDHTDALFAGLVFDAHREVLAAARRGLIGARARAVLGRQEIAAHYRRLAGHFRVEIESFERKRYVNLSREVNKAANLNSYLGLIGRWVREDEALDGRRLVVCAPGERGATRIPDADFVVTLDADSLLAPDYVRRLVAIMQTPGNERVAVAQTPYTAVPGAPGATERIAGATTNLQYLVHQGFTQFGATFWVGANALLRKTALDDIRVDEIEHGHRVAKFIQDRTVIEDTESTIDLVARGWRLHNEPQRLAYSATPSDFGSLLIQRRRWANGGLLILPKLVRYAAGPRGRRPKPLEFVIRAHYLSSLALSSFCLLMLLFPMHRAFVSLWLPLTGLPYLLLYWRDLLQAGGRPGDILRVYAFNWMLLPINLAGVLKSLQQAATGEKIPFGRTPKVTGRTAAPAWAVLAVWIMFIYAVVVGVWEASTGHYGDIVFTATTAAAVGYAIVAFIGVRASWEDVLLGARAAGERIASHMPERRQPRPVAPSLTLVEPSAPRVLPQELRPATEFLTTSSLLTDGARFSQRVDHPGWEGGEERALGSWHVAAVAQSPDEIMPSPTR